MFSKVNLVLLYFHFVYKTFYYFFCLVFTDFLWVLPSFTGFHLVGMGYTWVLLGLSKVYQGSTELSWFLCWVLWNLAVDGDDAASGSANGVAGRR